MFFPRLADPVSAYLRIARVRATPSFSKAWRRRKNSAIHFCGRAPEEIFRYANGGAPGSRDRVVWEERDPSRSCASASNVFVPFGCRLAALVAGAIAISATTWCG